MHDDTAADYGFKTNVYNQFTDYLSNTVYSPNNVNLFNCFVGEEA